MSAEKVRRYVFTGEPGGMGVGMRGDLLVNDPAHPVALNRTEYIEYTDVAGLVEAMKDYMRCTSMGFNGPASEMVTSWKTLRAELARWQS